MKNNWNEFSGLFAPIYKCPKHGEIWHVETVKDIDIENDEVYEFTVCAQCYKPVVQIYDDGIPVMHPLTQEEAYWESYSPDEDEESE